MALLKAFRIQLELIWGCLVLPSIAGIVWYQPSELLRGDVDGILLLAIYIMIGSIFSVQLLRIARSAGWVKFPERRSAAAASWATKGVNSPQFR
jgi:hypothetical protein